MSSSDPFDLFVMVVRFGLEVSAIVIVATMVFDFIHFALHRLGASRFRALRIVGGLHQAHHDFLDADLVLHAERGPANIARHVIPELMTRLVVSSTLYVIIDPRSVLAAQLLFVGAFILVVALRGRDSHHQGGESGAAPAYSLFVDPAYHTLHHRYPDSYFSSAAQVFDRVFGTACHLRGRRFTITGASGAFGAPLREMLEADGALVRTLKFGADWTYDSLAAPSAELDAILRDTDVLVLAHGSKVKDAMAANCTSFVALIERFKEARAGLAAPEVWALGSEIETHPAFGIPSLKIYLESKRAFARHARRYARDRGMLYRHIVPSAFTSAMGPGLMSGRQAARIALFFIMRGARYVPVTYTGLALLGFVKFLLRIDVAEHAVAQSVRPADERHRHVRCSRYLNRTNGETP